MPIRSRLFIGCEMGDGRDQLVNLIPYEELLHMLVSGLNGAGNNHLVLYAYCNDSDRAEPGVDRAEGNS